MVPFWYDPLQYLWCGWSSDLRLIWVNLLVGKCFFGLSVLLENSVLDCTQCLSKCTLYVSLTSFCFVSQLISFSRIIPAPRSTMSWKPCISFGQACPGVDIMSSVFFFLITGECRPVYLKDCVPSHLARDHKGNRHKWNWYHKDRVLVRVNYVGCWDV